MLFQTRLAPKISKSRKELLIHLRDIIQNSSTVTCDHADLGIAPFIHGGGFFPTQVWPELICKKCGLNITLFRNRNLFQLGIKINKKEMNKIYDWCKEFYSDMTPKGNKHALSASKIVEDPISEYKRSEKWMKPVPIKIIDKKLLESKSGT
jgi:hypothetical protein